MVEVTQEDRDRAEAYRRGIGGSYDREVSKLACAFAAHRIAARTPTTETPALDVACEALRGIMELPGEINPSNYDHDDACTLNAAFVEGYHIARTALTRIEEIRRG